ncbi:Lrp/AsnC family transcriptional regulator [Streptomyces silvisoli]|uniref:Lrp/AsnC family transcriptional regulator n=1 Tax=Streptomyces silvisoli TaxID=3034235 RepID=A0ABT5ZQP0_9ACTN|nr:Lrp/AsnC family transcriptional regulator [Streptomyces silvisoli]MDF3292031.1 Lrp/AsnC family transcriptional regulator [Streptomyces silvisoli]
MAIQGRRTRPGLDRLDREILAVLVRDGRATYLEVARRVRLSANAVADRVRRMRADGVIRGYRADLDRTAMGATLCALTDVRLREGVDGRGFETGLSALPQIAAAAHTTGEYDYQLRVVCADPPELESVVERLKKDHGVRELRSRLILREVELDPTRFLHV